MQGIFSNDIKLRPMLKNPYLTSDQDVAGMSRGRNRPTGPKETHASVVALQAQGLATQGRSLSTPAPLRALRARTPDPAWSWPVVGEGVMSCPRAGCGKSACPVR